MNPLLLPIVAVQGMVVRSRTEVLPEATGPTTGSTGDGPDPLRLGVLGESTAAGVGADNHDEGITGRLAQELAARSGRDVTWEVVGRNAATARRIRHRLLPELRGTFDVTVLLAGVNDVLGRRSAREWGEDVAAVVDDLAGRSERVLMTGIPPFDVFPALPGTLGRFLAEHAAKLDAVSREVCAARPQATWISSTEILHREVERSGPDFFARDRFHPSALGYHRWAEAITEHLVP
ncbi:SGNH/GDSL hydrolase family protein [Actinosynnema sp. NPDC023587]|uniref:SGNH/GDSL hydrolase family protein n=1 Tax=Actinosynnema sp. NPDC023587 TaxID=3154695 RepID=UPI0033FCC932